MLSRLFDTGYEPDKDNFVQKYMPAAGFTLSIAEGIDVALPPDRNFIGLMLAELHQNRLWKSVTRRRRGGSIRCSRKSDGASEEGVDSEGSLQKIWHLVSYANIVGIPAPQD